ncbi:MAG TPA: hypothetical protein VK707_04795 [Solirubrobacteraceae bacterium]|nr:hypothetical protein [Solirubrobacteraceae bacterium]
MSARRRRACRFAVLSFLAAAAAPAAVGAAPAATPPSAASARAASRADSVAATVHRPASGSTSQAGPPLTDGASPGVGDEAQASAEGSVGEADPLVSNGLGSPSCRDGFGSGELSTRARQDCETSGFVAAAAPTGDFGLDVHIDTGFLGLSSGSLLASVQNLCVTPLWMALVWAVHALVVMLEWCFAIDLLDSPSAQLGIARGLRQAQAAFTIPWLAAVFAVASLALAYDGLVRRRIGESLGRALLALAMTAAGLWVMLDPLTTIGALGGWANQASLGTLAVSARGSPANPGSTLDGAMRTVFAAVIEGPWCYLEFGDVGWCRNPRRLDPRLRAAALALAAEESHEADARALAQSARLLRSAQTNGAIFLALPANGPERNSINDSRSLLRAICQSEDATRCRGPSASEAEFRTNHGTWPRVGGLMLIAAGALGMLLLLGFIALRLLTAALFSLLYLLLAPFVALSPALGESGRAVFRRWAAQLLAAVLSKLLFSFVLGAVLAVLGILAALEALGWWTQWLLMSAFWWAAFMHRHQALALASLASEPERAGGRRPVARRLSTLGARRRIVARARIAKERLERHSSEHAAGGVQRELPRHERERTATRSAASDPQSPRGDRQATRMLESETREAEDERAGVAAIDARLHAIGARLGRIRGERAAAATAGDRRRAVKLDSRAARIELGAGAARGERDRLSRALSAGRSSASADELAARQQDRARFLDAQSALPGAIHAHRTHASARRDYVALAPLAGHRAREYEQLGAREQRVARLAIDRELAARRERLLTTGSDPVEGQPTAWASPAETSPGEATVARERTASGRAPAPVPWRAPRPSRTERGAASESTVMQDARAVAERRKRQLGIGRP